MFEATVYLFNTSELVNTSSISSSSISDILNLWLECENVAKGSRMMKIKGIGMLLYLVAGILAKLRATHGCANHHASLELRSHIYPSLQINRKIRKLHF